MTVEPPIECFFSDYLIKTPFIEHAADFCVATAYAIRMPSVLYVPNVVEWFSSREIGYIRAPAILSKGATNFELR